MITKVTVTKGTKTKTHNFEYAAKTLDDSFYGYLPTESGFVTVAKMFDGAETIVINDGLTETILEGYGTIDGIQRFREGYQITLVKG